MATDYSDNTIDEQIVEALGSGSRPLDYLIAHVQEDHDDVKRRVHALFHSGVLCSTLLKVRTGASLLHKREFYFSLSREGVTRHCSVCGLEQFHANACSPSSGLGRMEVATLPNLGPKSVSRYFIALESKSASSLLKMR